MLLLISLLLPVFLMAYTFSNMATVLGRMIGYALTCAFFVGALFKILHWPYANVLLLSGSTGAFLLYGSHVLNKPVKNWRNYLLLAWLGSSAITLFGKIEHASWAYYLTTVPFVLLVTNIIVIVGSGNDDQPNLYKPLTYLLKE